MSTVVPRLDLGAGRRIGVERVAVRGPERHRTTEAGAPRAWRPPRSRSVPLTCRHRDEVGALRDDDLDLAAACGVTRPRPGGPDDLARLDGVAELLDLRGAELHARRGRPRPRRRSPPARPAGTVRGLGPLDTVSGSRCPWAGRRRLRRHGEHDARRLVLAVLFGDDLGHEPAGRLEGGGGLLDGLADEVARDGASVLPSDTTTTSVSPSSSCSPAAGSVRSTCPASLPSWRSVRRSIFQP